MIFDRLSKVACNDEIVAYYLNEFYNYRIEMMDMFLEIIEKMAERHTKIGIIECNRIIEEIRKDTGC